MIDKLIYIANRLDEKSFKAEADFVDSIIKKAQEEKLISFIDGFEGKHFGETPFSTFDGSPEELLNLVKANLDKAKRSAEKEFTIIASQIEDEPMNPQAMMWNRYHWGSDSSSSQEFDEKLSKAFEYWKNKAMWDPGLK